MGRGNNSSAYRDMDEEFFASLEEANYECHESPIKKSTSSATRSESTILLKHFKQRRAVRTKLVVALTLLVLAGVGFSALYSSVEASLWAMNIRGSSPMFRGSSTVIIDSIVPRSGEVYTDENTPDFGAAIFVADEAVNRHETDDALDDAVLDELDPYDEFNQVGTQLEAN